MRQMKKNAFFWTLMLIMAFSLFSPGSMWKVNADDIPVLDEGGYYELSSASDLLWFANEINKGQSNLNGKLTGDIDLTDVTWIPIEGFEGIFDGQNYKITNINFEATGTKQGIFGTNNGVIENIGDVTGTLVTDYAVLGGLAGINTNTISNCHSSVTITTNYTSNQSAYGGIVGWNTSNSGLIEKCSFAGNITIPDENTVSYAKLGGIAGSQQTGAPSIIGCVNQGILLSDNEKFQYMGGIAGHIAAGKILFSYNQGTISASNANSKALLCGIAYIGGGKISNCYSSGTLSGGNLYPVGNAAVTNCYYLSDETNDAAGSFSDADLKKVVSVNAINAATEDVQNGVSADCRFVKTEGYPALIWEGKETELALVSVADVEIFGEAVTGKTIKAVVTGADGKEPTNVSYQWQVSTDKGYENIASAVYPVFTIQDTALYAGKTLRVKVDGDNDSSAVSKAANAVEKSDKLKVSEDKAALPVISSELKEVQILPFNTTGKNGCTIIWESTNESIISKEGIVTLPESGYETVKITATVTNNSVSEIKTYSNIKVSSIDYQKVTADKNALKALPSELKEVQTLNLPSTGDNGCNITWISNNTDVISNEGTVKLPASNYETVKLTATVVMNTTSDLRTFSIKVYSEDYQNVNLDKQELVLDVSKIYEAQALAFPLEGNNGSTITWTSNNTNVISNEGVVTLPATGYKYVTLTATIKQNETLLTKTFSISVYSEDTGNVVRDKEALVLPGEIKGAQTLELLADGKFGSKIIWTSNNTEVITNSGTVILPESGYITVKLTANVTANAASETKTFNIVVYSLKSHTNKIQVSFNLIGDDVHGNNPHTAFYKWIAEEKREYIEADKKTALNLVDDVFAKYGFRRLGSDSYISGVATSDGITLSERMNGSGSGWMYKVNGVSPSYALQGYILKDGDVVELYYTHSYGEGQSNPIDTPVRDIKLDKNEDMLYVGQTNKFALTVIPAYAANKNVIWSSSDESVVQVDKEGVVTAKKEGQATITGMAEEDTAKRAVCIVHVKNAVIELNKSVLQIEEGKMDSSIVIKTSDVRGDNIVSAASGDTAVATVDVKKGILEITGKKEGSTVIKVESRHGGKAEINVTVNPLSSDITTQEPVQSVIKLNYSYIKLQKGKSTKVIKIKSSVPKKDKMVSAKSSKKNIVSVSVNKGVLKITGKKKGTALITVTSAHGSTATVKVAVVKKVTLKSLALNKKKIVLKKRKKLQLIVKRKPVTATQKIKWKSSNEKVATVTSKGVVKAKKKGKATITVYSKNKKKATCKVIVK